MTTPPIRQVRTRTRSVVLLPTPEQIIQAALAYAEGARVIPINIVRHPYVCDWHRLASRDPATIRELFDDPEACGVGLVTDFPLLVLDIDGEQGAASLRELEARLGPLPATRTVLTPNGGRHLHFIATREIISAPNLAEGVEVKALVNDRQRPGATRPVAVPMPPSMREMLDGRMAVYRFESDLAPAPIPPVWEAEIFQRIEARELQRAERVRARPLTPRDPARPVTDYECRECERVLDIACEQVAAARDGQRRDTANARTYWVGQHLWGLDYATARERLIAAYRASGTRRPAWMIEQTIDDALSDGETNPMDVRRSTMEFRGPPRLPASDDEMPVREPGHRLRRRLSA